MLTIGALVLLSVGGSLVIFPPDSDAAIAASDPVYYAIQAEHLGLRSIVGHHPLFHLIVLAFTEMLRACGAPMPGAFALRIVSGMGAAVILVLVLRASGPRRWAVGAGFALVLLATRSFILEAGVGESVIPGCAAALWAIDQATRTPFRAFRVWSAFVIALLVRQDNVLLLPGLFLASWQAITPSRRARDLGWGLLASGAVTIAAYLALWWISARSTRSFPDFLLHLAEDGQYNDLNLVENFPLHLDALSGAVVGRVWEIRNAWVGPAFVLALIGAGVLLRGRSRIGPAATAIGATLLCRMIFYTWFDVRNWEWSTATLVLVAWLGSRMADGEPVRPPLARACGAALLAATGIAVLATHLPFTLTLGRSRFTDAMRHAAEAGAGCRFIASGHNVDLAFQFLGIRHALVPDRPDARDIVEAITQEIRAHPVPTLVAMDRWIFDGDPYRMIHQLKAPIFLDAMESTPAMRMIRWEGLTYAIRFDPTVPR